VRCAKAGSSDPGVGGPWTVFLSEEAVNSAQKLVEQYRSKAGSQRSKQKTKKDGLNKEDTTEPGLPFPISVFDECERSFVAANENQSKVASGIFSDTGLMALICWHDHVLYMVNMTSSGEKQFYAIALLQALFGELPQWWKMGILYDISCQLDRSMKKVSRASYSNLLLMQDITVSLQWNMLPSIWPRIEWGVSVFHAFAHQWPCQCVYNPQKHEGFGQSDGEGCERCWGRLKKLISICHVSGVSLIHLWM